MQRLTWLALRYAGAPHAACPSTTRENPPSSNPGEPSRMDKYKDAVKENLLYIYIYIYRYMQRYVVIMI